MADVIDLFPDKRPDQVTDEEMADMLERGIPPDRRLPFARKLLNEVEKPERADNKMGNRNMILSVGVLCFLWVEDFDRHGETN